ncbi:MAG: NAD(P)-binding domain-containing protein [Vicinamibacterales bacterium]
MTRLWTVAQDVLSSGTGERERPRIDAHFESNVKGLFVIGDLAGAPVIKLAMEQGFDVIRHIASLSDAKGSDPSRLDLVIVGAGASGLNAALEAQAHGLRAVVLEKGHVANTIENFPEGKWVYAEPDSRPPKGKLWLDGATKEDLVARWHQIVADNRLDVRAGHAVERISRAAHGFDVVANGETFKATRVILAIGQRGNPRKLGVPGEDREPVYHRLYSPRHYSGEDIVVVGGGNSAIEAALVLSEQNRVTLSYRGETFGRVFKDNARRLDDAVREGRLTVLLQSRIVGFDDGSYRIAVKTPGGEREEVRPYRHAFVLVGAELPVAFLKSVGIELENEWRGHPLVGLALGLGTLTFTWMAHAYAQQAWPSAASTLSLAALGVGAATTTAVAYLRRDRYAWLALSFLAWYSIYAVKVGSGTEFWPFNGWGYKALSFFGRPWSFWYTVLYTTLMTGFGVAAMKRWGFDRKDSFQIWRYVSLLSFQWIFFFIVPEFLFEWAVKYQWVGELARDHRFADQSWRAYGLVYAWPLFFYTFFYNPHWIWVLWGIALTFVVIPIFVLFHGKRYCSWICGCGGLAETFGDRWRHLAPKGETAMRWERMQVWVLGAAAIITVGMLAKDAYTVLRAPTEAALGWYRLVVDVWLVGILPVTLYPFLGGKVWCRYWCPLAKFMHLGSALYGRFAIRANDKCIACGECSRYCQVGIPVMQYALKQEPLTNATTSCIGCGICVSACPMDVLSFGTAGNRKAIKLTPVPVETPRRS